MPEIAVDHQGFVDPDHRQGGWHDYGFGRRLVYSGIVCKPVLIQMPLAWHGRFTSAQGCPFGVAFALEVQLKSFIRALGLADLGLRFDG